VDERGRNLDGQDLEEPPAFRNLLFQGGFGLGIVNSFGFNFLDFHRLNFSFYLDHRDRLACSARGAGERRGWFRSLCRARTHFTEMLLPEPSSLVRGLPAPNVT
jgi:hypothetical protein